MFHFSSHTLTSTFHWPQSLWTATTKTGIRNKTHQPPLQVAPPSQFDASTKVRKALRQHERTKMRALLPLDTPIQQVAMWKWRRPMQDLPTPVGRRTGGSIPTLHYTKKSMSSEEEKKHIVTKRRLRAWSSMALGGRSERTRWCCSRSSYLFWLLSFILFLVTRWFGAPGNSYIFTSSTAQGSGGSFSKVGAL